MSQDKITRLSYAACRVETSLRIYNMKENYILYNIRNLPLEVPLTKNESDLKWYIYDSSTIKCTKYQQKISRYNFKIINIVQTPYCVCVCMCMHSFWNWLRKCILLKTLQIHESRKIGHLHTTIPWEWYSLIEKLEICIASATYLQQTSPLAHAWLCSPYWSEWCSRQTHLSDCLWS